MINTNRRVGKWVSQDGEVGAPDPTNPYRYVGNAPTNATDPSGLAAFALGGQTKKEILDNLRKNGIDAYPVRVAESTKQVEQTGELYLILSRGRIVPEKFPPALNQDVVNAMFGRLDQNKVFRWDNGFLRSDDLNVSALQPSDRVKIFEGLFERYGRAATQGVGYKDFKDQEWTQAGYRAVLQQLFIKHPGEARHLLTEARKAGLQFGVDTENWFRGYRLDPEKRLILIKKNAAFGRDRSVESAADELYDALKEYTTPSYLSRLLNGAGRVMAAGAYDFSDPADQKLFDEWDANNRLGINYVYGQARREAENQAAMRAGTPLVGAALGRVGKAASKLVKQLDLSGDDARALLREALGQHGTGKIAHHLVPLEAIKAERQLMEKAALGGFNINGANNGILLTRTQHIGGHPQYNAIVIRRLREIPKNLSPQETAQEVQKVADILMKAATRKRNPFLPQAKLPSTGNDGSLA